VLKGEGGCTMRNKHRRHQTGIQDNYPDHALDLRRIYMPMKARILTGLKIIGEPDIFFAF
jgi:hypothetical protein